MERLRANKIKVYAGFGIAAILFIFAQGFAAFSSPLDFPVGSTFVVNENESLKNISRRLEDEHVVGSALLFRMLVSFKNKDRHVQLGVYEWDKRLSLTGVVERLTLLGPNQPLVKVTVPEGSTNEEIVAIAKGALPNLSEEKMLAIVRQKGIEGKLFPSTYFLLPSSDEEKVVERMLETFTDMYRNAFAFLPKPSSIKTDIEVLSLAAILEGEAKTEEDMKIVSGILQKRLAIKMPLQVDVAKETYKERGLPKVPINNPGEKAIRAVFEPIATPYLYYITGKDGTMYYAKTYDEHRRNISRHLR